MGGRCDVTRWEGCPGSGSLWGNTTSTPLLREGIAKRCDVGVVGWRSDGDGIFVKLYFIS